MPSPTVFLLGATGYLGSTFLKSFAKQYPNVAVVALVRGAAEREAAIRAIHPNTTVVEGSLQSTDLIRSEASKATVVINCANPDDVECIQGIYQVPDPPTW